MTDSLPNPLFESIQSRLNSFSYYQSLLSYPKSQRWLIILGLFVISQIIVFGSLYLFIGKVAMIGFFICILFKKGRGVLLFVLWDNPQTFPDTTDGDLMIWDSDCRKSR